ncbi:hypothetical protein TRFO_07716 [Tritrichomonas foetus]|uniref:Uncharacterized protein n=1 Tax=Tritrichomonas foetus TaxID=1144522 RepID=A0A1J4JPI1_9EUKA|nr:hypothetical protein TRFO_07716 [Tritrichomonas foetus]|eukprot:OHT01041.1 hypothetical protein TRFO_07716 [Tritrichomonas foetus]
MLNGDDFPLFSGIGTGVVCSGNGLASLMKFLLANSSVAFVDQNFLHPIPTHFGFNEDDEYLDDIDSEFINLIFSNMLVEFPKSLNDKKNKEFSNINEAIINKYIVPSIKQTLDEDPSMLPILFNHLDHFVGSITATSDDCDIAFSSGISEILFDSINPGKLDVQTLSNILNSCINYIAQFGSSIDCFLLAKTWLKSSPQPFLNYTSLEEEIGYHKFFGSKIGNQIIENRMTLKKPLFHFFSNLLSTRICLWRGYLFVAGYDYGVTKCGTGFYGTIPGTLIARNSFFKNFHPISIGVINDLIVFKGSDKFETTTYILDIMTLNIINKIDVFSQKATFCTCNNLFYLNEWDKTIKVYTFENNQFHEIYTKTFDYDLDFQVFDEFTNGSSYFLWGGSKFLELIFNTQQVTSFSPAAERNRYVFDSWSLQFFLIDDQGLTIKTNMEISNRIEIPQNKAENPLDIIHFFVYYYSNKLLQTRFCHTPEFNLLVPLIEMVDSNIEYRKYIPVLLEASIQSLEAGNILSEDIFNMYLSHLNEFYKDFPAVTLAFLATFITSEKSFREPILKNAVNFSILFPAISLVPSLNKIVLTHLLTNEKSLEAIKQLFINFDHISLGFLNVLSQSIAYQLTFDLKKSKKLAESLMNLISYSDSTLFYSFLENFFFPFSKAMNILYSSADMLIRILPHLKTPEKLQQGDSFYLSSQLISDISINSDRQIKLPKSGKLFDLELPITSKIIMDFIFPHKISCENLYLFVYSTKSQKEHIDFLPPSGSKPTEYIRAIYNASYAAVDVDVTENGPDELTYTVNCEIPILSISKSLMVISIFQFYWEAAIIIIEYLKQESQNEKAQQLFDVVFQNIPNFDKTQKFANIDISLLNTESNIKFIKEKLETKDFKQKLFYLTSAVKLPNSFPSKIIMKHWNQLFTQTMNMTATIQYQQLRMIIDHIDTSDSSFLDISKTLIMQRQNYDDYHLLIIINVILKYPTNVLDHKIIMKFVFNYFTKFSNNLYISYFEKIFEKFEIKIDKIDNKIKSALKEMNSGVDNPFLFRKYFLCCRFLRRFMTNNAFNDLIQFFDNCNPCLFGALLILSVRYAPITVNDSFYIESKNPIDLKLNDFNSLLFVFETETGARLCHPPYDFHAYLPYMNYFKHKLEEPLPALNSNLIHKVIDFLDGPYHGLVVDALCDLSINSTSSLKLILPTVLEYEKIPEPIIDGKKFRHSKEFSIFLRSFFSAKHKSVNVVFYDELGTNFKITLDRNGKYKLLLNDQHNREICIWSITDHFIASVLPGNEPKIIDCYFGLSPTFQVVYLKLGSHFWVNSIHSTPNIQNARIGIVGNEGTFDVKVIDTVPDILVPTVNPSYVLVDNSIKTFEKFSKKAKKLDGEIVFMPFIKNEGQKFYMEVTHNCKSISVKLTPSFVSNSVFYHFEIPSLEQATTFGILIDFSCSSVCVHINSVLPESIRYFPKIPFVCLSLNHSEARTLDFNFGEKPYIRIDSDFTFPSIEEMKFVDYFPKINESPEKFQSYHFSPAIDCPFRPSGLTFPIEIGRPAFLNVDSKPHIGMIKQNSFESSTLPKLPDEFNKLSLWSTPFDTCENVEIATIHSLFFIRDRVDQQYDISFNRIAKNAINIYDGNFCNPHNITLRNYMFTIQHQAETMIHILSSKEFINWESFHEYFIKSVNILATLDLRTDTPFSALMFEKIKSNPNFVTYYLIQSRLMFTTIDKQFLKTAKFRSIHANSVGNFERISDLECDLIFIRPTKLAFINSEITLIDRNQNSVSFTKNPSTKLVTFMRSEFIFDTIHNYDVIMCYFIPIDFKNPHYDIGYAFPIHFINHVVELIKETKDRELAKKLHDYFLHPVWEYFMENGEVPFDEFFAGWLSVILTTNNVFDLSSIHSYYKSFKNENVLIESNYNTLVAVSIVLIASSYCYFLSSSSDNSVNINNENTSQQREKLFKFFQPDVNNSFYHEFKLAVAADLANPLGSHFPLLLNNFPLITPLINQLIQITRPFDLPKTANISNLMPNSNLIYEAPLDSTPITDGFLPFALSLHQCNNPFTGNFFIMANPSTKAPSSDLNISFISDSNYLSSSLTGLSYNDILFELSEKWDLHFEALCFYINTILSILDIEITNFRCFEPIIKKLFPTISIEAALFQLMITKIRYRRKYSINNHKTPFFGDLLFILEISPDVIQPKEFVDEYHKRKYLKKTLNPKNQSDTYFELSKYFDFCFPHNYQELSGLIHYTIGKTILRYKEIYIHDIFVQNLYGDKFEWKRSAFLPNPKSKSKKELEAFTAFGTHLVIAFERGLSVHMVVSRVVIRYAFDCDLILDDFADVDQEFALHGTIDQIPAKIEIIKPQLEAIRMGVLKMKPITYHFYFKLPFFPRFVQLMPIYDIWSKTKLLKTIEQPYAVFQAILNITQKIFEKAKRSFKL